MRYLIGIVVLVVSGVTAPAAALRVTAVAPLPRQQRASEDLVGKILGNLAIVTAQSGDIRRGRDPQSTLLSTVSKGTYLAVVDDRGEHYGILMLDRSTGWIHKSLVRMVPSQVAVGDSVRESPSPPDARTTALLQEAVSYLKSPGASRTRLDSSRLVQQVFAAQGIALPRRAEDQAKVGTAVRWEDLRAGDRLYFDLGQKGRVNFTGIYLGYGYFIYASHQERKVRIASLLNPHFYQTLVAARRSD